MLTKISNQEMSRAYENFQKLYHPTKVGVGYYFWNFIGADIHDSFPTSGWKVGPKVAADRIKALAGPHYKTIAKMIELNGADPYTEADRLSSPTRFGLS